MDKECKSGKPAAASPAGASSAGYKVVIPDFVNFIKVGSEVRTKIWTTHYFGQNYFFLIDFDVFWINLMFICHVMQPISFFSFLNKWIEKIATKKVRVIKNYQNLKGKNSFVNLTFPKQ